MTEFGYKLSSEEHAPRELVHQAARAEEVGFDFAMISDHFHPWVDRQGHSPLVWSVLGGIAHATERLRVGTAVTCPTFRYHPAIVAQAAATTASMMPGRFVLGLGSGENLNEHIIGAKWPEAAVRLEMLEEAVAIIRQLWRGENESFYGAFYTVENARLYTLPDELPPILIAASGKLAATLAGECGDGFIGLAPERELLQAFDGGGSPGRPKYAELTVCWAESEQRGIETALEWWPNTAVPGALSAELPLPRHFEQAASLVRPEDIKSKVVCGPDLQRYVELAQKYIEAGYDHLWFHQIGPDQESFFKFYERELAPALRTTGSGQQPKRPAPPTPETKVSSDQPAHSPAVTGR